TAPTATTATREITTRRMMRALDCLACTCWAFSRTASRELRGVGTFGVSSLDIIPLEDLFGDGFPSARRSRACRTTRIVVDGIQPGWEIPRRPCSCHTEFGPMAGHGGRPRRFHSQRIVRHVP